MKITKIFVRIRLTAALLFFTTWIVALIIDWLSTCWLANRLWRRTNWLGLAYLLLILINWSLLLHKHWLWDCNWPWNNDWLWLVHRLGLTHLLRWWTCWSTWLWSTSRLALWLTILLALIFSTAVFSDDATHPDNF